MNVSKSDLIALVNGEETIIAKYREMLLPQKLCKCCGSKFIPESRLDEIYCPNCRHTGYEKTMSLPDKEYRKQYKTQHARLQRGAITKEEFEQWKRMVTSL